MELKKQKNKNQETDGYETDKRPRTEKLKRKEITLTENKKNWNRKKAVMQSGYPWNQSKLYNARELYFS